MLKGSERSLPILSMVGGSSSEIYFLRRFVKHFSHDFLFIKGKLVSGEFIYFYVLKNIVTSEINREVLGYVQQSGLVMYVGELCGDSLLLRRKNYESRLVLYFFYYLCLLNIIYFLIISCYLKQIGVILYVVGKKCQQ